MMICMDDFGMTEDINRAAVELAQAGKVDAVSCMVNVRFFTADALAALGNRVQVGLHITLAETPEDFRSLVKRAYRKQLDRNEISREVERQADCFEQIAGRRPDFIDGHLHVQQLPVIRDAVIEFILKRYADHPPRVRNAAIPLRQCSLKSFFIAWPGRTLKRKLKRAGIPTNDGFGGIYDYRDFMRYPDHLERFLRTVPDNGIIMVHPGLNEPWRRAEYDALRSR
jgi:predicted glycoside hydrolase/deacetylase ChbG (UPF0249 family)